MKVRVLKKLPFAEVGEVINISDGDYFGTFDMFNLESKGLDCGIYKEKKPVHVFDMINKGWLEKVKEESLTKIIYKKYEQYLNWSDAEKLAQIAKEHYLEVFDKSYDKGVDKNCDSCINVGRKALEQA